MPYKTDSIALKDPFLDRRVKLLPCQREMVHYWYNHGYSITSISKLFKVNKRLIQFELFPERKKRNLELRHDRVGTTGYYNREEHNEAINDYRRYKNKILKHTV